MTKKWERRWRDLHARHRVAQDENARLRAALDELNEDIESFLNDAYQGDHERAKSHMIRRQAALIREWRPIVRATRLAESTKENNA